MPRILGPLLCLLWLTACGKEKPNAAPSSPAASTSTDAAPPAASSLAGRSAPDPAPTTAPVPAAPAVAPQGTATLVLQRVYADCGGSGSWGGSGEQRHLLGTDVFVLLRGDDPKAKPQKEFAFCPSHAADGGPKKPQLQIWENCQSFPACQILSGDAGTEGRVEVQCGKEHIVVESDGTHTILRGSFGVRELLPHPTKVAPVKSEVRMAMVDC